MAMQAWSPDGKQFAASGNGLHLVTADGTAVRRLTPAGMSVMGGTCQFSPDGRRVLFVKVNKGQSSSLYVTDTATGKARPVVEASNLTDVQAVWSPDGRRIAFSATMLDEDGNRMGETSLFVCDADGKNTTTVRTERHEPNIVKLVLTGWR
jgi:Tol biopolymer transport system component